MPKALAPLMLPGFFRAIAGFIVGLVTTLLVAGLIRQNLLGTPMYLIGLDFLNDIPFLGDAGAFWNDQATFMWAMFGGALGYLWGAGAIYGAVPTKLPETAIVPRIPSDPDAPHVSTNPLAPLMGALPALAGLSVVLVLVALLVGLMPYADFLPKQHQVSGEEADTSEYGEGTMNIVGLVEISGPQEIKFAAFAFIAISGVMGTALFLAGIFYVLNLQIKGAIESPPDPEAGANFPPFRYGLAITRFFTDWALDVLGMVEKTVRPR